MAEVRIKRVYEEPAGGDGRRILVDRVWPRGLSKEKAKVDVWLKEVAPSTELRRWFGHDPQKWSEFRRHYFHELEENPEAVATLRDHCRRGPATLLFGAREERYNHAVALAEYLQRQD